MAATSSSIFNLYTQSFVPNKSIASTGANPTFQTAFASSFSGASLPRSSSKKSRELKIGGKVIASATAVATPSEEILEYQLPTWARFEIGRAPVYWKTMNGLPPTAGEKLKLFYNPEANELTPHEDFGIAFNGGFNQPIMCGGEPRAMLRKIRGKADPPFYTIQICIPKHAVNLIFSFTNGVDWDGPYRLQFQVPRAWRNKPIEFFNKGLAKELSKEGACERAIFPDTYVVASRCALTGNLTVEGGDRCNLDLVPGCMDTSSPLYNPLATFDDGSCPLDSDTED